MKHTRIMIFAAVCSAVLALKGVAAAEDLKQGYATIVRIEGEARYSLGDGSWHPLLAGKILKTAHDAKVDIVLGKTVDMPQAAAWPNRISPAADSPVRGMVDYKPSIEQNMVRMTGDSTLAIDKLNISDTGVDTVSDTELDLRKGRIYCTVKKLSATSEYLVKIPNGIAGVRGTVFGIGADGWCACFKNSVLFSIIIDGKPTTVMIKEGNLFNATTGQIIPLTRELISLFTYLVKALDTSYWVCVSFTFDRTQCHISPTHGTVGRPSGSSGGGGGGLIAGGLQTLP
jgi:hypothetical protein